MQPFSLVFLAALGAALATRLWLARRQLHAVHRHRERVPAAFAATIPPERHRAAADYTAERIRFDRVDTVVDSFVLLIWTLGGGIALVDAAWRSLELSPVITGTGVIATVVLISALIDLPLRAWRTFVIEARHGFNRSTPGLFVADQLRAGTLLLIIGLPLLMAVLWLIHHGGTFWWIWVWLLWLAFNLAMVWAWPRLLAPLFNRFDPLPDTRLRERIERLLRRCGFRADGVFVVDGSRRSSHGNAYFTGFGRQRRIVFYDTLLEQLDHDEVEAVLAHELGHFRHGHIARMIGLSALLSLVGLALLAWLIEQPWFHQGLGVPLASVHAGLLLFLLVSPVVTFFLKPLFAGLSRHHEFEADRFAAHHAPASALISALVKLYRENASTLTPDPLYAAFHASHPPAAERIAHLRGLSAHDTGVATEPAGD